MLNVENVTGGYSQACIIKGVSFRVEKGQLFGILGPNGSGKSTLMKMVSGILPHQTGRIFLDGKPLGDYSSKQLARKMAALPQHTSEAFSYTVKEVVSIGRYAHQSGWLGSWTAEDERAVLNAMEQTGVNKFAESPLLELSGGERQRVYLAQALAQEPEILLLDEPTNHLDLAYQKELLDFLLQLTKKTGLTVISIFHDLNLAGLYCDQLMLMENGKVNLNGQPADVLQEKRINEVYATNTVKHAHPQMAAPQIALMRGVEGPYRHLVIDDSCLSFGNGYVCLKPQEPLWTLAYGGEGAGMGWRSEFAIFQPCEGGPAEKLKELGIRTGGALVTVSQDLGQTWTIFKEKGEFSVFSLAAKGAGEDGALTLWLFVNAPVSEEGYLKMLSSVTAGLGKARPQSVFHPKDCLAVAGKKAVAGQADKGQESLWALVEEAAFKAADGLLSGSAFVRTQEYKGE